MDPREQDLEQTAQSQTGEKKRRFRIVKLEERLSPLATCGCSAVCTDGPTIKYCTVLCTHPPGHCK